MELNQLANYAQVAQTLPIVGGIGVFYLHHKCHNCWRISRHNNELSKLCRKCHGN